MLLSLSDLEGLIVILLVIFLVIALAKKAMKFVLFVVTILCLMQVGFWLSQTDLNNKIPLDKYFKYDIVSSVTQIFNDGDDVPANDIANEIVNNTKE